MRERVSPSLLAISPASGEILVPLFWHSDFVMWISVFVWALLFVIISTFGLSCCLGSELMKRSRPGRKKRNGGEVTFAASLDV
jgi:hypothetical protein